MKKSEYVGLWHIYEMEDLDEDYLNMEVQAYIRIGKNSLGEFQFGLVSGQIDGRIVKHQEGERFEFTWTGNDECDDASGSGWLKIKDEDIMEGEFRIHLGDSSKFRAQMVKEKVKE